MSKKRRSHSPDFKAKVAMPAIEGDETLSELARRYNVNANLIVKWKKQLMDNSGEVFASGKGLAPDRESESQRVRESESQRLNHCRRRLVKSPWKMIFQSARSLNRTEHQAITKKNEALSVVRQCGLLDLHRSGVI